MSKPFVMPALSPTMEKGTLARWLVAVGDTVRPGDVLAEVETDKATMELQAEEMGVVEALLLDAGSEDVPVGTVIARLAAGVASRPASRPEPQPPQAPSPAEALGGEVAAPVGPDVAPEPSPPVAPARLGKDAGLNVSPLAARVAAVTGIDLGAVRGSGAAGRIVLADVSSAATAEPRTSIAASSLSKVEPQDAATTAIPPKETRPSQTRRATAHGQAESELFVPLFYLTNHLRADALLALREELNDKLSSRGVELSIDDFLIKATALSIALAPDVSARFAEDAKLKREDVHVALSVAVPSGSVAPVIRSAASKPVSVISSEALDLANKARHGELPPDAYEGGIALILNLSEFGVDQVVPVINAHRSLVVGFGSVVERVVPVDGEVKTVSMLTATAGFDHRAIGGPAAAQFMAVLRRFVEDPFSLLVA